jgi:hypothetical protein
LGVGKVTINGAAFTDLRELMLGADRRPLGKRRRSGTLLGSPVLEVPGETTANGGFAWNADARRHISIDPSFVWFAGLSSAACKMEKWLRSMHCDLNAARKSSGLPPSAAPTACGYSVR